MMNAPKSLLLCFFLILSGSFFSEAQSVIGYFSVNAGDRQLGSIDPTNGTVTFLGSPLGGGSPISSSGGTGAFDFANNLYFFVGTPQGSSSSIFSVNATTGVGSSQILSATPINGLEFDDGDGTLYAIMGTGGLRQLATVNPTNGTVTLIGSDLNGGNQISSSNDINALDATGNRMFFAGTPNGGSLSIYTINTATGVGTPAVLSNSLIVGLEYDEPGGVLYGIFRVVGMGIQLGTINPATGAVTLIGSPLPGAVDVSSSTGASSINLAGDEIYWAGQPSGGSRSIFTFSLPSGSGSLQTLSQSGNAVFGMEFMASGVPVELFSISVD